MVCSTSYKRGYTCFIRLPLAKKITEKGEVYMTAREFLSYAGWEGDLEKGLAILGRYVGKGSSYYISFPDAEVLTEDGESLSELPDEPAAFQEYASAYSE